MGTLTEAKEDLTEAKEGFHSINVPSEWGHHTCYVYPIELVSFHSINVPSEWGHHKDLEGNSGIGVSIQLMSPASGDFDRVQVMERICVSIQLMSPASGDTISYYIRLTTNCNVSIQLMSPASGDFFIS